MKLVTRTQWGARAPRRQSKGSLNAPSTSHWNGPTITVSGKTLWDHTKCAGLIRGIQNFHMDVRGWSDIAYNFVECPHGYTFVCRGLNIINGANGTNTGNQTSHAIMSLAGEGNPFTDNERVGFRECVRYISDLTAAPDRCVGHRDHKSTECPGNDRYNWVHAGMPTPATPVIPEPIKKKGTFMEAALLLVKIHYDNARGDGKGSYDVSKNDPKGYQHWVTVLLDAFDKNQPLKPIVDNLGGQLYQEMLRRG